MNNTTSSAAMTNSVGQKDNKENNKNSVNFKESYNSRRFTGANECLKGKVFEVNSRDSVQQYSDTLKAIADYVGQHYTHGGDIRFMIENLTDYNFVRPNNPQNANDQFDLESQKKQLDIHWKRRGVYVDNKMKLYSLIWGQLTKSTQSKLETHQDFQQCKSEYDGM
jgi:hypothetical protein